MSTPDASWIEDPDLASAVAEVEEFAGAAGWDRPPQLFALVRTADLARAEPQLAARLAGAAEWTPIAQDALPEGDLADALATVGWPPEVAGCVLVQEILVLPPVAPAGDTAGIRAAPADDVPAAGTDPAAPDGRPHREGRLVAGVLRDRPGGACLLRMRDLPDTPLRGADLAPNLLAALRTTLSD
ncbi:PPA1309 family protein [Nakamurella endophytica]|uniref:Uncharacterized protein n=1 Tax=Nakamurella endophytica TaxID=1748367 RepID=A0A917T2A2_9ACTN|nr:PPA1309 family protein [Nakamurella endophytica]GGM07867.1 hypothetical protein GCM10011594_29810 [Nakamurella endophytica]